MIHSPIILHQSLLHHALAFWALLVNGKVCNEHRQLLLVTAREEKKHVSSTQLINTNQSDHTVAQALVGYPRLSCAPRKSCKNCRRGNSISVFPPTYSDTVELLSITGRSCRVCPRSCMERRMSLFIAALLWFPAAPLFFIFLFLYRAFGRQIYPPGHCSTSVQDLEILIRW